MEASKMSTYRVRPNKTNRVWPPSKDVEEAKTVEENPTKSNVQNSTKPTLSQKNSIDDSPNLKPTKQPLKKNDSKFTKQDSIEIPSRSLLRPVKNVNKKTTEAEVPEKKVESPIPSKSILKKVKIPEKEETVTKVNNESNLKSNLRPVKQKEPSTPTKEKFEKPALRSVKSRAPEETEPTPVKNTQPDCDWKREAWRRQNRWSQRSTEALENPSLLQKSTNQETAKKTSTTNNKGPGKMDESQGNAPGPPPPPPPPPGSSKIPTAPPPKPGSKTNASKKPSSKKLVEDIRKATRTRPDWKTLMKDLEGGIKLKHVKSEDKLDRSSPLLPANRKKEGKFLYESEIPDKKQSELLNEIQKGIKLRKVKTNDRSKPDFQKLGMKKFRRQMTIEEKKTIPVDAPEALPSSSDEDEDIDRMRDDLKATKTQLAEEIKKTKKMEREMNIQNIDVESLRAEVKKLKRQLKEAGVHEVKPIRNCEAADMTPKLSKSMSKLRMREEEVDFSDLDVIDEEIKTLEEQIDAQRKRAEKAEQKIDELNSKLKLVQNSSDEWELRSVYFEKKFKTYQKDQGIELPDIRSFGTQTDEVESSKPCETCTREQARKIQPRRSFGNIKPMESFQEESESEDEDDSEEESSSESSESESDETDESSSEVEQNSRKRGEENEAKRKERDLSMWNEKVSHSNERIRIARRERNILRDKILKYYANMRIERKEYLRGKQELQELVGPTEDDKSKSKSGEADSSEEDLEDMTTLEDPVWSATESEDESEPECKDQNAQIRMLQDKHHRGEKTYNNLKKESHKLKTQVTRCDEMFNEEKRRHQRLDNELQMLLTCLE